MGLRQSLDLILDETMESTWERHARLAEAVRQAVNVWSNEGKLKFNVLEKGHRSNAVTTILCSKNIDPDILINYCREKFCVILGVGIGAFEHRSFRIAHMGNINEAMILGILGTVETTLLALSISREGGVQAAINYLASQ